ncbi:hypothetical protein FXO38_03531 [Capsicum annuum]|nr:hypothetical protein FXO38_03531 [Capsicum annuum]
MSPPVGGKRSKRKRDRSIPLQNSPHLADSNCKKLKRTCKKNLIERDLSGSVKEEYCENSWRLLLLVNNVQERWLTFEIDRPRNGIRPLVSFEGRSAV